MTGKQALQKLKRKANTLEKQIDKLISSFEKETGANVHINSLRELKANNRHKKRHKYFGLFTIIEADDLMKFGEIMNVQNSFINKDAIAHFLKDLNSLVDKIATNNASIEDYETLDKMFKLAGMNQQIIQDIWTAARVGNWKEFLNKRARGYCVSLEIIAAVSRIKGVYTAIDSALRNTYLV